MSLDFIFLYSFKLLLYANCCDSALLLSFCVWCFCCWPVCNETHKYAMHNICWHLHNHRWELLVAPHFFLFYSCFCCSHFLPFHFQSGEETTNKQNKQLNRFNLLCMLIEFRNQHLLNVFNNWIFPDHYFNEMEWCLIFIWMYNFTFTNVWSTYIHYIAMWAYKNVVMRRRKVSQSLEEKSRSCAQWTYIE